MVTPSDKKTKINLNLDDVTIEQLKNLFRAVYVERTNKIGGKV